MQTIKTIGFDIAKSVGNSNILLVGSIISTMAVTVTGIAKAPQDPFRGRG